MGTLNILINYIDYYWLIIKLFVISYFEFFVFFKYTAASSTCIIYNAGSFVFIVELLIFICYVFWDLFRTFRFVFFSNVFALALPLCFFRICEWLAVNELSRISRISRFFSGTSVCAGFEAFVAYQFFVNEVQLLANSFPGKLGHSFRTRLSFHFPFSIFHFSFSLWALKPLLCLCRAFNARAPDSCNLLSDFLTFYLGFNFVEDKLIV